MSLAPVPSAARRGCNRDTVRHSPRLHYAFSPPTPTTPLLYATIATPLLFHACRCPLLPSPLRRCLPCVTFHAALMMPSTPRQRYATSEPIGFVSIGSAAAAPKRHAYHDKIRSGAERRHDWLLRLMPAFTPLFALIRRVTPIFCRYADTRSATRHADSLSVPYAFEMPRHAATLEPPCRHAILIQRLSIRAGRLCHADCLIDCHAYARFARCYA